MDDWLFLGIAVACFAIGLPCQRPRHVFVAVALWMVGLGVAAVAGAFDATAEDNALGVFVFTGLPTVLWLGAFCLGAGTGFLVRRHNTAKRGDGVLMENTWEDADGRTRSASRPSGTMVLSQPPEDEAEDHRRSGHS